MLLKGTGLIMGKLHGKSVLLGIGIGVIVTALLGLIYSMGYK